MEGKYKEALTFYTQGLEAKPEDAKLILSLLLNRAAVNLTLGMFLKCNLTPSLSIFFSLIPIFHT